MLKQGLNIEKLKQCPSFENAKTSTFRIQIWHKLTKEYYQKIKKPSTSKVNQLYYLYKKATRNQNIVFQNVQKWRCCRYTFSSCHRRNIIPVRLFQMQIVERLKSLSRLNVQFFFLWNPQKSSLNICLMKILKITVTKKQLFVLIT